MLAARDGVALAKFLVRLRLPYSTNRAPFVGDLHQPLHVGAIYLDAAGIPVTSDLNPQKGTATETEGAMRSALIQP